MISAVWQEVSAVNHSSWKLIIECIMAFAVEKELPTFVPLVVPEKSVYELLLCIVSDAFFHRFLPDAVVSGH